MDFNLTSESGETVVCGGDDIVVIDGVENEDTDDDYDDDDKMLNVAVVCGWAFVFFDCFNFSSAFFVNKSRKHLKPVLTPVLITNEPSISGKHICFFNSLISLSSMLRFKI
ncbi:unnamed protein product [Rotaria magnacalcarata]|uniref:Transmembrane protein n=2 Tax=Rotaria magnacalcarata TaxID=392030 RepID=A0A814XRB7_9BILA|nr:unnamed protein product [Rotaria magnacalcarata]CAF4198493.1 unnamed protein product [Rotaria magnacalcarata]